ncbi:MAG TPA: helix-turn-helix domain-containing protein [Saprospiraceae bacterium]|nr:helix-turn-helix domain-containing protein [Saprospiraceae bacterium]HMP14920.1 helix-turn-helix domain-containing protein [Saprospiraceae bacterium]
MRKSRAFNPNNCPVTYCLNRIGGKWKPVILHLIRKGCNRFSMLQKAIPDISKQMLVNQLRELENDNILQRIVFAEIPPRVEYALTELGLSLLPVIDVMEEWGSSRMELNCES